MTVVLLALFGIWMSDALANTADPVSIPSDSLRLIDAVRISLALQPEIQLQNQAVLIREGELLQESGAFDVTLDASARQTRDQIPLTTPQQGALHDSSQTTDATTYRLGLKQLLRSGITLSPGLSTTHTGEDPPDYDPVSDGRVDFLVTLPLLRGKGEEATTADEKSAAIAMESEKLLLLHTVSQKIRDVIIAYWNDVLAQLSLEEQTASEARAARLLNNYAELVQADERPAGDLQQLTASLSEKTAARIASGQSLYEARQDLGIAMGVAQPDLAVLPAPVDRFTFLSIPKNLPVADPTGAILANALNRRMDYQASQKKKEQQQILVVSALNRLKPQLDINLNLGYSGMDEGDAPATYITPLFQQIPGPSAYIGLNYTFPVANTAARGLLTQRRATLRQAEIQHRELARTISASLSVALRDLYSTSEQVARFSSAVTAYRQAARNEVEKYQLGMSTLLDILTLEDRLTQARLNELETQARLATSIARLRFESGLLATSQGDGFVVLADELTAVPDLSVTSDQ